MTFYSSVQYELHVDNSLPTDISKNSEIPKFEIGPQYTYTSLKMAKTKKKMPSRPTMWTTLLVIFLLALVHADASAVAAPAYHNTRAQSSRVISSPKMRRVIGDNMPLDEMPSLFSSEEEIFDRYAACLAATEGLRRIRDRDLAEELQKSQGDDESTSTLDDFIAQQAKNRRKIAQAYIKNSGRVLRAMGMSVKQFNELGGEIAQDSKLKGKVRQTRISSSTKEICIHEPTIVVATLLRTSTNR